MGKQTGSQISKFCNGPKFQLPLNTHSTPKNDTKLKTPEANLMSLVTLNVIPYISQISDEYLSSNCAAMF